MIDFIGQASIIERLKMYIQSALERNESLDHILLEGAPGLGKSRLAKLISKDIKAERFITALGTSLQTEKDITSLLMGIGKQRTVIFIDEIHRMHIKTFEALYNPMENFVMQMLVGKRQPKMVVESALTPFTLIAATTHGGNMPQPLRDRFRIKLYLDYYSVEELTKLIMLYGKTIDYDLSEEEASFIADRSRGTPRIAKHLTKSTRDIGQGARHALKLEGVGEKGINNVDAAYLQYLSSGKSRAISTIAKAIGANIDVLLNNHEPFLFRHQLIEVDSSGRKITSAGLQALMHHKKLQE